MCHRVLGACVITLTPPAGYRCLALLGSGRQGRRTATLEAAAYPRGAGSPPWKSRPEVAVGAEEEAQEAPTGRRHNPADHRPHPESPGPLLTTLPN